MIFQKYKKWIIIGLVVIAAFVLYTVFFTGDKEDQLLTSTSRQTPEEIIGTEIIGALQQIESLELDRSIFDNPIYRSLKDRSQEIPPEPIGKSNPFDPIGSNVPEKVVSNENEPKTKPSGTNIINQPSPSSVNQPVI